MKGYRELTKKFSKQVRPQYYSEIVKNYEIASAHFYGGENLAILMDEYRIAETLVRKADRLKLTMAVCKDYFKNFTNGVKYTLLANGLLQPSTQTITNEDGTTTEQETPAKVEIIASDEVKEYAFKEMNLWAYFRDVVVPKNLLDPNGLLVMMPSGNGLSDTSVAVDLKLWYVPFKNIHILSPDEIIFEFNGFYYYVSTEEYRRFILRGNRTVEFDTWYYPHKLGYPVWSALGGMVSDYDAMETNATDYNETGDQFFMFESFIGHAFEKATLAVRVFTDIEIMRQVHTHPYIEMESSPCAGCGGQGCKGRESDFVDSCQCPDKSGEIKPSLPIGSVLYRQKSPFRDEKESAKPLLSFTAPDTSAIEWQGKYLEQCKNDVKEALNLYRSDQMQSGVAKQLDDNPRQLAVAEIAGNLYELMRKTLQWINDLRKISDTTIEIKLPEEWRVKV